MLGTNNTQNLRKYTQNFHTATYREVMNTLLRESSIELEDLEKHGDQLIIPYSQLKGN